MRCLLRSVCVAVALVQMSAAALHARSGPFDGNSFQGRIAYSCDGNHNDPDDWAASPVALAILAEFGVKDRVVHFDYNCILPETDSQWEKTHETSVLGAAQRYGYDLSVFHNWREDLDAAVDSIARAINASSADDPLYFILAGPMQAPLMGIEKSDPEKRKHVYCISHSRWNDGFARRYKFTHTKRSVIPSGITWVQIRDQNALLSTSPYGRPAGDEHWRPWHWMRDSDDPKVRFLWERMVVSERPDCSDAGMAYFLLTGDEQADPNKLRQLLDTNTRPAPIPARTDVRLEAENFTELHGFVVEDRNDRSASHRLGVILTDGTTIGRIGTRYDQPYTAPSATHDVEVRYFDGKSGRSQLRLSVGGVQQGETWTASADTDSWQSRTFTDVPVKVGDEIAVEVLADSPESGKLDYVQLNYRGGGSAAAGSRKSRFTATGPLDDPEALPGQIIVAGRNPDYLKYNGAGPAFLCGPDNPETFLFLGDLKSDGTRSNGEQQTVINRLVKSGANAFHCQMFRMRRCNIKDEGDDQHCPFVDFDPKQPLNSALLDQWDGWISQLEEAGVVIHLEFYNDATDVEMMGWTLDENGNLHPDEKRMFEGIVKRFKHHKNIIWGIEESVNKLPRARTPHFMKLSELIARVDNHHHPIVHSFVTPDTSEKDLGADKVMSDEYIKDPNIQLVTWLHVLPHGDDYEAQHQAYLKYSRIDSDRFIAMKNETERFPRTEPQSRIYQWSCAMTGMHALEAGHDVLRRQELLAADGHVVKFMEETDFHTMKPADNLAAGSTKWVLASSRGSYIAYTYACTAPMGVKGLDAGTYDLLWFDTATGATVRQTGISVPPGGTTWPKPDGLGGEIALYVRPSVSREGRP
jgi:hypothetical protein